MDKVQDAGKLVNLLKKAKTSTNLLELLKHTDNVDELAKLLDEFSDLKQLTKELENAGGSKKLLEQLNKVDDGVKQLDEAGKALAETKKTADELDEAGKTVNDATGTGQGFNNFNAFKKQFGPAGTGRAWHHIVEQNPSNIQKFGPNQIHNTKNILNLPHGKGTIHAKISGHYSSIQPYTNGQTVRKWLCTKSFDFQYNYGIEKLTEFGWKF